MFGLRMLVTLSLATPMLSSFGCTCEEHDPQVLFKNADGVFLARVTDTKLLDKQSLSPMGGTQSFTAGPESADTVEAKFLVLEYFKKPVREIREVHDLPYGIGNCSIPLMSGLQYVFFTSGGTGKWNYVGMCTGSSPVNPQSKDYSALLDKLRGYGKTK